MSQVVSSIYRVPLSQKQVKTPSGQTVNQFIKTSQAAEFNVLPITWTKSCSDCPLNLFRNSGSRYTTKLDRNSTLKIQHVVLQIKITINTAAVTVAPISHWFSQIVLRNQSGNSVVGTFYPDAVAFNLLNFEGGSLAQLRGYLANANMSVDTPYAPAPALQPGTYTFYLPLSGSFLSGGDFFWRDSSTDFTLEFTPDSAGIAISGTNANIDCAAMNIIIQSEQLTDTDTKRLTMDYMNNLWTHNYLDVVPVASQSRTLTAGSTYLHDLTSVVGKSPFCLLSIRATGASNVGNAYWKYLGLGDDSNPGGTIDLVDSGNKSILGSGAAIPSGWLRRELFAQHIETDYGKQVALYMIPFSNNVLGAMQGEVNGYFHFKNGEKMQLAITPGAAAVNEQQTITLSAAPTSGFYRLAWKGRYTDQLAFNASAASMGAALSAVDSVVRDGLTFSFSAALSAGTTSVATITSGNLGLLRGEQVQVTDNNLLNTGVGVSAITSITTAGNGGFTTGTYDITAYFYIYKTARQMGGLLSVRNMD